MPAATWPTAPGCSSCLVARAAVRASALARLMTVRHAWVCAPTHTSGTRGLARSLRALLVAAQVSSTRKMAAASADPQTRGLPSFRASAVSNQIIGILRRDEFQETCLKAGQLDGYGLGDDPGRR